MLIIWILHNGITKRKMGLGWMFQHFMTFSDKSDWQVSFPTIQTLSRPHSCQSSSVFHYTRLSTSTYYGMSLSWNHLICPKDFVILLNTDLPAFVLLEVTLYLYYWYLVKSWNLQHVLQQKWILTHRMDSVAHKNKKLMHACILPLMARPSLGTPCSKKISPFYEQVCGN